MKTRFFTHFVLSAALLLTGLPIPGMSQGNKPDATINITSVTIRTVAGGAKVLDIAWQVSTQGGAAPQKFDVRANARLQGGGSATRTLTVNSDARFAKLLFNPFDGANAGGGGNAGGIIVPTTEVKAKVAEVAAAESKKGNGSKEVKTKVRAANLPGETAVVPAKGNKENNGGNVGGGQSSPLKPAPQPGGNTGPKFFIESALVTVTGTFRTDEEAINLTREFVPPANQNGELKPRAGNNNADVVINKLIEIEKSPRAKQCAAGRDCFEIVTGAKDFLGNGGKGFTLNLEVLYADGSRKTAVRALPAPGRTAILEVENPKNLIFTSARATVRGAGDGLFTRKATRDELLSM